MYKTQAIKPFCSYDFIKGIFTAAESEVPRTKGYTVASLALLTSGI